MTEHVRGVRLVVTAHQQLEGGGFVVRRPFPSQGIPGLDPFLLLDELGPVDYAPGEAVGAPDHPHRGFETVTYLLEGAVEHKDSQGNRGLIEAGGVQWMTAGAGIVHSEMPTAEILRDGGRVHGFQLWVNLPASHKMTAPRYQGLRPDAVPVAEAAGVLRARVRRGRRGSAGSTPRAHACCPPACR
jgi:redox-sensitive bicupin YhaK (pirin superfamily)